MVRSLSPRAFTAAAVLASFAGFADGFGFVYLGGYFVSFMSGNTTRASVDVAQTNFVAAAFALLLIASFVTGALIGTLVPGGRMRGETRVLVIILGVVVLAALCASLDWRWVAGALLAFSMGAMNTVFARGREVSFGITYMTGALVKVAQGIATALRGGPRTHWVRYLVLWLSIGAGAAIGAGAFAAVGGYAIWFLALVLAVLLVLPGARKWLHV